VRTKFWIHAAVLAITALGVLVFGSAAMAHGKSKPLRLVGTPIQSDFIDLGAPGPSLGDEFVASETLSRRGHEVGEAGIVCTTTEVVGPYDVQTLHCVATLSLRKGQITLQGLIEVQGMDDPGPFTVAITGGTGKFRGASGEARIRARANGTTVYKLKFDHAKKKHKKHHR
jgi:hypothetical protein